MVNHRSFGQTCNTKTIHMWSTFIHPFKVPGVLTVQKFFTLLVKQNMHTKVLEISKRELVMKHELK